MLHLYRRALAVRRSSAALSRGTFAWRDAPDGVLLWERDEDVLVAVNMTGSPVPVAFPAGESWTPLVSSAEGDFDGTLAADSAVWLARG